MEIINNQSKLLGDDIKKELKTSSKLKIAASCFSIYSFDALKEELDENNSIKRGNVYESDWNKQELKELPYCMNIKEIYSNLIFNLIDLKPNDNEEVNCYLERFSNIGKLKKEISALEKKAFKEVQPKKKFEMGRIIRKQKVELKILEGDDNGEA